VAEDDNLNTMKEIFLVVLLAIDDRIILKLILSLQDMRMWTGYV